MNNDYKTYEELKEELGNNYDLYMYEINLYLLQKIDKAIEYIKAVGTIPKQIDSFVILEILGDKENERND